MQHPARTELWAILRLSGPLIASQLAHMLVLTDTLMMARLSPEALGRRRPGRGELFVCVDLLHRRDCRRGYPGRHPPGRRRHRRRTRLTQAGLWLAWLMALMAGLLLWNLKPVLLMFGQTETNVQSAGQFLMILPFALPGYLTFMALRGFTSAIGKATPVMVISLSARSSTTCSTMR
ncbi:drug/sodium antiporter [Pseudomonas fluorescens]|uniref:Drug/sodium antiporter n=1 Tax=Pseudomonas fluorescens TaxID=294 RepID=A0A379I4Y4_PSEFL|nr:drug/sodium antiporter [Pseudomonas fluorescens]